MAWPRNHAKGIQVYINCFQGQQGAALVGRGFSWRTAVVGLSVMTAGCAVGPNFHKPTPWTPKEYGGPKRIATTGKDGTPAQVASQTTSDDPDTAWWTIFNDPELTKLEQRVATDNLDVRRYAYRMAQSRAELRIAGAERYPAMSATGSYARQQYSTKMLQRIVTDVESDPQLSNNPVFSQYAPPPGQARIPLFNQWRDSIDATWEVDLWGRVRRQYEAAAAQTQATNEARRGMLISRQAEVARDYMDLRNTQEQLRIVMENRDVAKSMLDLNQQRYAKGLASDMEVEQARVQYQNTLAQLPQLEQQLVAQVNALSLLMGEPPRALSDELLTASAIPPVPPRVPVGVPSELARRRPDIRRAEANLHAATAQVGEAVAEFYPRVTINAGFGFESLSFRDLGFWNAKAWNVGPSITLPIFQGGRLRGQLELRKAAQKEAAISYQQTVLGAWHDIDNALTAYTDEQVRHDNLTQRMEASHHALQLAQDQYRHGMVTYLNVLDSQRQYLGAQSDLTTSTATISGNLVRLYNALGGGWETTYPEPAPRTKQAKATQPPATTTTPADTTTPAPSHQPA
ncbi:efflux transporter outer membrane subunit [Komagataeibacter europaeus]|uniref:efflux transporter outer membrane subunit n=1 Tax=Komagataeibacter europaeus TaxID=33995 RepID=UPI0015FC74AC|nr:efflux transporter outer membrane subunit [Komagataeibacter europaeus]